MKKSHPARRPSRVMAIAAKRFDSHRPIRTYFEAEEVGHVNSEGIYQGGYGNRYRLGDVARRMTRAAMCHTVVFSRAARRNIVNACRELRLEGY